MNSIVSESTVKTSRDKLNNLLSSITANSLNIENVSGDLAKVWTTKEGTFIAKNINDACQDIENILKEMKELTGSLNNFKTSYQLDPKEEITNQYE